MTKTFTGTEGDDILHGHGHYTAFHDLGGNDQVYGGMGHDYFDDGAGNDLFYGKGGNDYVTLHSGDNIAYAGDGNDVVIGGSGFDTIYGGEGSDVVGHDTGETAGLKVNLRTGDVLDDGYGNAEHWSSIEGVDLLFGFADIVIGSDADDRIISVFVADYVNGGLGDDTISAFVTKDSGSDAFKVNGGAGSDTLEFYTDHAETTRIVNLNHQRIVDDGFGHSIAVHGIESFVAGNDDADDRLTGTAGVNTLGGGSGDDVINGGAGSDIITGGSGFDQLTGGEGADTFRYERFGGDVKSHRYDVNVFDTILDFHQGEAEGDRIDLSAVPKYRSHPVVFTGMGHHDGVPNQAFYEWKGGETVVTVVTSGNGFHQFEIHLAGELTLTAADFIL